ncbi:hypothetical protein [Erwinia sp. V71]|uniref:hypothetical protein n=1 Tax=Erwinia sp. V71 TaxID=3369424 RepID=UPI003F60B288
MSKETGGPAFPELGNVGYNSDWQSESGMTMRDYFAAKAINGILSDPDAGLLDDDLNRYAVIAYRTADAMLKARGQ